MLLKSWSKVQIQREKAKTDEQMSASQILEEIGMITKQTEPQKTEPVISPNDAYFYCKSIKIFDFNRLLKEVLVEQFVPSQLKDNTKIDSEKTSEAMAYDVSTLTWERYMYYFKRIRNPITMKTSL